MKVGGKVIMVYKDGYGDAFSDGLQTNPAVSSTLSRLLDDSFELSLERYGIKDHKACGNIVHFADQDGNYQVTLLILENYEPPVLACAVNEVLLSITEEEKSVMPTLIFPVIVSAPKLKLEKKYSATSYKTPLFGVEIGPESHITSALLAKCENPPPSLQIHYEPLSCFLQLARVSKLSTCVLIGQSGQRESQNNIGYELEVVHLIGGLLASISSLCFSREKIRLKPTVTSKNVKEPWRALYG